MWMDFRSIHYITLHYSAILEDGGMKIKKWMSNNASVLKAIPIEDRAVSSQHFFESKIRARYQPRHLE